MRWRQVAEGKMPPKTLKVVSSELLPLEMYVKVANQSFQEALEELEKK